MKYAIHTRRLLSLAIIASCLGAPLALAQRGPRAEPPRTPTPHLADGTVDLGGNGIWNLPWVTDFAVRMPGYQKGDQPPMLPWTQAMWEYNKGNSVKYDPEGFCLPPGGPRSMGTPYPVQFIQQKDRMVLIFEGGGHVWREIHMDGREHPKDLNPTYFGHSIAHWDGDTLVVDTIGFNEKTWLDFGGYMHTEQLHTVERISRPFKEVLHYETTIDDPGAYRAPWVVAWDIPWSEGDELQDYICQENNKFLLDMSDDLGQPFFEKSGGL
ncbi:MAG: hypothetical protein LBF16_13755 [Pseudomonadales bacterium]|jgi:hypothetical protein|nr:hypothetical protein [Pseudomonadales bacterium]